MQKRALKSTLLICSLALSGGALAGASATMLADTCAGCHGTDGVSYGPATPTIAGASSEYIIEMMTAYKNAEAPSTIMTRIAKGYTGEQIALMAGYFAKQKFVGMEQSFDADKAAKGAKLHDKYCEKCHAEGGSSAEDDSGILAGQWTPYLAYTMEDFLSGSREMPKKMKKKMKKMLKKKGDGSIDLLLNYYASQK